MVDAEFVGSARTWPQSAQELHQQGLLDSQSLNEIIWAHTFGEWIGNTDMHLGNLSVTPREARFELLPIYDMLPMAFAPVRGDLPPQVTLRRPVRTEANRDIWGETGKAAAQFWRTVATEPTVTSEFQSLADTERQRCEKALSGLAT